MSERERADRAEVARILYERMFVDRKFSEEAFDDGHMTDDLAAETRFDR